jgi:DNA polymerase III alpha subunit (gram-positive type)
MSNNINFTLWFEAMATKQFKMTIKHLFKLLDEQTQLHTKEFRPTQPSELPMEYLEYQIKYWFQDLAHKVYFETISQPYPTKYHIINKHPLKKPVMLNTNNSMIQIAKLSREITHYDSLPQLAFVDIETDALSIDTANILQVAIIKPMIHQQHSMDHYKSWNKFILPYQGYNQKDNKAYNINQIGDKQLATAIPLSDVTNTISELLKNTVIVGYNCNSFDIPILKRHLETHSSQLLHKFSIDLYPACWKNKKQNLASAIDQYNLMMNPNPHDALADASCCIDLLFALVNNHELPGSENELLDLSTKPENSWNNRKLKVIDVNTSLLDTHHNKTNPPLKRKWSQISSASTAVNNSQENTPYT